MKNKSEISYRVMKEVVQIEERQTKVWNITFITILCSLFILLGLGLYQIYVYFNDYQLFAFFDLFKQDWEIISDYWQETIIALWDESPKELLLLGLIVCGIILTYILITRRKRSIVQKKIQQISHYRAKIRKKI
jgi:hypothetical protein